MLPSALDSDSHQYLNSKRDEYREENQNQWRQAIIWANRQNRISQEKPNDPQPDNTNKAQTIDTEKDDVRVIREALSQENDKALNDEVIPSILSLLVPETDKEVLNDCALLLSRLKKDKALDPKIYPDLNSKISNLLSHDVSKGTPSILLEILSDHIKSTSSYGQYNVHKLIELIQHLFNNQKISTQNFPQFLELIKNLCHGEARPDPPEPFVKECLLQILKGFFVSANDTKTLNTCIEAFANYTGFGSPKGAQLAVLDLGVTDKIIGYINSEDNQTARLAVEVVFNISSESTMYIQRLFEADKDILSVLFMALSREDKGILNKAFGVIQNIAIKGSSDQIMEVIRFMEGELVKKLIAMFYQIEDNELKYDWGYYFNEMFLRGSRPLLDKLVEEGALGILVERIQKVDFLDDAPYYLDTLEMMFKHGEGLDTGNHYAQKFEESGGLAAIQAAKIACDPTKKRLEKLVKTYFKAKKVVGEGEKRQTRSSKRK